MEGPLHHPVTFKLLRPHYPQWYGSQGICGNHPRIPSKAYKLTSALAAKAYSAAGQTASALHTMAILQVHQAKALKSFALWAMKVMALISLYSPYFIVPKKTGGFTTNPGSTGLELVPSQACVQYADTEAHSFVRSASGMVCSNQHEGRILSCLDMKCLSCSSPHYGTAHINPIIPVWASPFSPEQLLNL